MTQRGLGAFWEVTDESTDFGVSDGSLLVDGIKLLLADVSLIKGNVKLALNTEHER